MYTATTHQHYIFMHAVQSDRKHCIYGCSLKQRQSRAWKQEWKGKNILFFESRITLISDTHNYIIHNYVWKWERKILGALWLSNWLILWLMAVFTFNDQNDFSVYATVKAVWHFSSFLLNLFTNFVFKKIHEKNIERKTTSESSIN